MWFNGDKMLIYAKLLYFTINGDYEMVVNENSTTTISIEVFDENGIPIIPDTIEYKILDKDTKITLQNTITINPTTTKTDIVIPESINSFQDENKQREGRIVSISTFYQSKKITTEFIYYLKNLESFWWRNEKWQK